MTGTEYEIFVRHFLDAFSKSKEIQAREFLPQKTYTGLKRKWKIDISYSLKDLGFDFRVFVECKKWNKIVDVNTITWIHDAITDCGAQKGTVVTTKGYTKPALEMAKKIGIGTATLNYKNLLSINSNADGKPAALPYTFKDVEKLLEGMIYPIKTIYDYLESEIGIDRANLLRQKDLMNYFSYDNGKLKNEVEFLDKCISKYKVIETGGMPLELTVKCEADTLWYEIMMYRANQTYNG